MNLKVIDILLLDNKGKTDHLQDSDSHQYDGANKFNPKSFKLGQSVGYIDVEAMSYDLLFTQVSMLKELMFNAIQLKRYNHLVGNGGSKVWSKRTTQTAVPWKTNMECPMVGKDMPGCYCPIMSWSNKEMFFAHRMLYHIDQHQSHHV